MLWTGRGAVLIGVAFIGCAVVGTPADTRAEITRPSASASVYGGGPAPHPLAQMNAPRPWPPRSSVAGAHPLGQIRVLGPRQRSFSLVSGAVATTVAPSGGHGPGAVIVPARIRVIDGDTFAVGRVRFRLRGVDTPERGEPGWLLATRTLDALLRTGPLTVVPHGADVYGRTLVDVYVGGRDVAAILRSQDLDTRHPPVAWSTRGHRAPRRPSLR